MYFRKYPGNTCLSLSEAKFNMATEGWPRKFLVPEAVPGKSEKSLSPSESHETDRQHVEIKCLPHHVLLLQLLQWTSAHSHTLLHWNCLSVSVSPFDWKLLEGRDSIIFLLYPQSLAPCSHEWSLKNAQMMAPVCAPTPCPQLLIPTQCHVRKLHCAKSTVVPCVAQVLQNCKVCDWREPEKHLAQPHISKMRNLRDEVACQVHSS